MCKPHKVNGAKGSLKQQIVQERKAVEDERQQLDELPASIPEDVKKP